MLGIAFEEQIALLGRRLQQNLPGTDAHLAMAPASRVAAGTIRIDGKPCRKAAVLAVLFPIDNAPGILLTKRKHTLSKHAGQISFPGGKQEHNESLEETALRETHEEIGLHADQVKVLGSLSPIYINVSNFCVYPFVGAITQQPESLRPHDAEVESILQVPLPTLADPATEQRENWILHGKEVTVPYYAYEGETIWGATAMMLSELLCLFKEMQCP